MAMAAAMLLSVSVSAAAGTVTARMTGDRDLLFTRCVEDLFATDGNGSYWVKDSNLIQAIVCDLM